VLYHLPNYGEVVFESAYAVSAPAPSSIIGRQENLEGARLIRMYDVEENPHRSVTVSVAETPTMDTVRTYYRT
jgi:hypothetical protein